MGRVQGGGQPSEGAPEGISQLDDRWQALTTRPTALTAAVGASLVALTPVVFPLFVCKMQGSSLLSLYLVPLLHYSSLLTEIFNKGNLN